MGDTMAIDMLRSVRYRVPKSMSESHARIVLEHASKGVHNAPEGCYARLPIGDYAFGD